jgi:hypothetical protein
MSAVIWDWRSYGSASVEVEEAAGARPVSVVLRVVGWPVGDTQLGAFLSRSWKKGLRRKGGGRGGMVVLGWGIEVRSWSIRVCRGGGDCG